jgi:hypothetical protein
MGWMCSIGAANRGMDWIRVGMQLACFVGRLCRVEVEMPICQMGPVSPRRLLRW